MAFAAVPVGRVAQTISGGNPRMGSYLVAAGATFLKGDPVKLSATNDEITGAGDNPAAILGFANDDAVPTDGRATNVGKYIGVTEATLDVIFSVPYVTASPSTDLAVGDKVGINLTGAIYTVDTAKANDVFVTRGIDTTDPANTLSGATQSRVLVSVLAAASQAAGGDVEAA